MGMERIKAIHWVYDKVIELKTGESEEFFCAVDQKEAELLGFAR